MIVHNFNPVFIDLGFFQIKWYSLAYIIGIIFGWIYANKIIKKSEVNNCNYRPIKTSEFDDLIFYLIIGIILGGRLGYIIFYDFDYYIKNLLEIFKIWKGGMSFHGGLLGVILTTLLFSSKRKINFFKFTDVISCVAPIGIFLGRMANFINGELYGKISTVPWAIIFPEAGSESRHPSQLYEAILEGIILFIIINFLAFRKKFLFKPGYVSGYFLISYSVLRIIAEYFREPDLHLGYFFSYFSLGVLLSLLTLIFGFLIIFLSKRNEQNN
mgnify:CR=1 FL=1